MDFLNFQGFALYQIITTVFCLIMVLKIVSQYRRHERSLKELIIWTVIWFIIGFFAFFPTIIDYLAQIFGVKSGAIGFLAIWVIFLTYAFFRTFIVVENIDKKITDLTRKTAFDNYKLKKMSKDKKR